jgi:hypothetical protein
MTRGLTIPKQRPFVAWCDVHPLSHRTHGDIWSQMLCPLVKNSHGIQWLINTSCFFPCVSPFEKLSSKGKSKSLRASWMLLTCTWRETRGRRVSPAGWCQVTRTVTRNNGTLWKISLNEIDVGIDVGVAWNLNILETSWNVVFTLDHGDFGALRKEL